MHRLVQALVTVILKREFGVPHSQTINDVFILGLKYLLYYKNSLQPKQGVLSLLHYFSLLKILSVNKCPHKLIQFLFFLLLYLWLLPSFDNFLLATRKSQMRKIYGESQGIFLVIYSWVFKKQKIAPGQLSPEIQPPPPPDYSPPCAVRQVKHSIS